MTDPRQTDADALAACTGSTSVTLIDERRNEDGTLTELGRVSSTPVDEREQLARELVVAARALGSQSGVAETMRNSAEKLRAWQDEDAMRYVSSAPHPRDVGVDRAAFDRRFPGSRERLLGQSRIVVGNVTDSVYLPPSTGQALCAAESGCRRPAMSGSLLCAVHVLAARNL